MSKDTDVKAYILHPITKRWEGCTGINIGYNVGAAYQGGFSSFDTDEGIILNTAKDELIEYGTDISNKNQDMSYPLFSVILGHYIYAKMALSISLQSKSKNI